MSLADKVQMKLDANLKAHSRAMDKMLAVRSEMTAFAKQVGVVDSFFDGFSYYAPEHDGRNSLLFSCVVEGYSAYIDFVVRGQKDRDRYDITYENFEAIVERIAQVASRRLTLVGRYKI